MFSLKKEMDRILKRVKVKRINKKGIVFGIIALVTVLLNIIAWNSSAFCDAYITYLFPIWVNTYGRLTGLFPFSVGEWMLVAGVVLVLLAVLLGIAWAIAVMVRRKVPGAKGDCAPDTAGKSRGSILCAAAARFYYFFAWVVLIVCVIMTLNCTILYHASTFSEKYFGEDTGDYTLEDCLKVYNLVAENCNRLSGEVARDTAGKVIYAWSDETGSVPGGGSTDRESDYAKASRNRMADEAIACMQKLGKTYPQLDGWYPRPKPMAFSDFMCQQYMCGYYFPFSMEANYNDVMYLMNKPATLCHELGHLRGYIFEDEANFVAYLACLESEDPVFQYSGYLSVLTYLYNDLYKAGRDEPEMYQAAVKKVRPVKVLSQVWEDNVFVEQQEWDRINAKAWFDTETVDEISDTFTDTTLKLNGVDDGMVSYSRVVRLLLQYYTYNSAM